MESERSLSGKELAESLELPEDVLLKILQQLVRGRLLASRRGRNGGFWLARNVSEISLKEVLEAIEGPQLGHTTSFGQDSPHRAILEKLNAISFRLAEEANQLLGKVRVSELTVE